MKNIIESTVSPNTKDLCDDRSLVLYPLHVYFFHQLSLPAFVKHSRISKNPLMQILE